MLPFNFPCDFKLEFLFLRKTLELKGNTDGRCFFFVRIVVNLRKGCYTRKEVKKRFWQKRLNSFEKRGWVKRFRKKIWEKRLTKKVDARGWEKKLQRKVDKRGWEKRLRKKVEKRGWEKRLRRKVEKRGWEKRLKKKVEKKGWQRFPHKEDRVKHEHNARHLWNKKIPISLDRYRMAADEDVFTTWTFLILS